MNSKDYRRIICTISKNAISKNFPGLKAKVLDDTIKLIAKNVHARMYGANVDGVDSPIWSIENNGTDRINDPRVKPKIDAKDLLND